MIESSSRFEPTTIMGSAFNRSSHVEEIRSSIDDQSYDDQNSSEEEFCTGLSNPRYSVSPVRSAEPSAVKESSSPQAPEPTRQVYRSHPRRAHWTKAEERILKEAHEIYPRQWEKLRANTPALKKYSALQIKDKWRAIRP